MQNELFKAIIHADLTKVKELLRSGIDVNIKGFQGYTPIQIAISWRNEAIINELYNNGANVLLINDHGRNAIDCAREYKNHFAMCLFKGKHV